MAVAAAAANFVTFGILFSFGLFLTPLTTEFGASTGAVAAVFSWSVLSYYLAGAIGGLVGDRRGTRPVVAFGAAALPLGLLLAAGASTLWQLTLAYVLLVGLGVGSCYAPLIGAVGRAMPERGSLAIAVVLTGVGAGTLTMPVVIRVLLDRWEWRTTFRLLAGAALVILVVTAGLVADRGPSARRPSDGAGGTGPRPPPWDLFRSAPFRRLYLSVILIAPGFFAPLTFLNDYAIDRSIDPGRAALLVGAIGGGSVATRIAFGSLAPRLGPMRQYRLSHLLFLAGLACWLMAGGREPILVLAALTHGVAWAAWVTAAPQVLAGWFGLDDLGMAVGGFYTGLGLGALVGPPVTGAIIDAAGYRPALWFVVATTVAALVVLGLTPGRGIAPVRDDPVG
jgi:MFS family permease